MVVVLFRILIIGVVIAFVLAALSTVSLTGTFVFNLSSFLTAIQPYYAIALYLLPMKYIKPLLLTIFTLLSFRIVLSILRVVLDLLPIK